MRKLLAILLILAMLIPTGVVAQADEVETKPFCLLNWTGFENEYTNVYPMAYFWSNDDKIAKGEANVSYNGVSNIPTIAKNLKETFDTYPEGARFINFCMVHDAVHSHIEDACFMDGAVPIVSGWLEQFLAEYSRIGGKLDGLFVVVEYMNIYSSYIHGNYFKTDPLIYNKIVNNPTYTEKIRPQLVERGFKFYPNPNEHTPEIYGIYPNSGSEYATSRAIWNSVMRSYLGQIVTDCCAPLWKYYPDAVVSDYQSKDVKPWFKEVSENGDVMGGGGIQTTAGNCSNDNFSFNRPDDSFFTNSSNAPVYQTIPGYNDTVYEHTPFNRFLYDINVAKNTYLSSDNGNLTYWIGHIYYGEQAHNAYYAETILHLGMVNPKAYHGYILKQDCGNDQEKYETALKVVDDCLRDLTRLVGAADRTPIAVDPNWNHAFVLSGMNAGGKNIWRLTPDTSKTTLEDFKVNGTDPTFTLDGETITFPQGKIIEGLDVVEVGTCGYWIETPEDVLPVITREENYFHENPAFQENFESYTAGTEYNYNNALPVACWEPKKSGSSTAVVQADSTDADNQVLALKGTYTLKNVKMPDNVTAGDTYAEKQAWEISFTLPADMPADAELILLNGSGEKKTSKDGGFKIAGGKVYYSQNGEYVEMADVTLTAGTKYTVVRDMDFSAEDAITCDYYIYDASGTELGKAVDVAVAAITIPVYSVSFGCSGVTGEAVLLDDYKLYPTHVATDFYLYDATTGMQVAEPDKAKEGSTAFRLSWLNSTQTEKTYSVVAAYYSGEALVEEKVINAVKMAPGGDGVVTGVVENKTDGQTLRVYLRDDNPDEPDGNAPTDGTAEAPGAQQGGKLIPIIIAAAAVVVIAAVVVAVILTSKKKKKPAKPTEE